ncbi:uridine kinase family protein [Tessaracoccus sp. G1721]
MTRTLLLVAGPSGSGKSRLTRLATADGGAVALSLDDFYLDVDHPGLPTTPMGIPDWDDLRCWDLELAVATLRRLLDDGEAEVPRYDISLSRRVGMRRVELAGAEVVVAEGIFAPQTLVAAREAGIAVEALWLDRRRETNFVRRLLRDLEERRKPPLVLVRRGVALYRAEPALRLEALTAGFTPSPMRAAVRRVSPRSEPSSGR